MALYLTLYLRSETDVFYAKKRDFLNYKRNKTIYIYIRYIFVLRDVSDAFQLRMNARANSSFAIYFNTLCDLDKSSAGFKYIN